MPQISKDSVGAMLSFCLPGLGQIAQGRKIHGMIHFALFAGALLYPKAHWLLPFVAGASAYDAFRPKSPAITGTKSTAYRSAFLVGGFCGFLLWMVSFFSSGLPYHSLK